MFDRECRNILVRGANWIGDAVMTMPALAALRKNLPGTKIFILVKPWVSPLFENNPNVDEIIAYEESHKTISGKFRLSSIIRKKRFCSSILFQNAFDAALITRLAGIPQRIGYNRDFRGFLLTEPVPFNDDDRKIHHIEYYLNLMRKTGIKAEHTLPYIYLSIEERLKAREVLKGLNRPVIGINPGAAYGSSKRWPPERFAKVSESIISGLNGSVVIFGSRQEAGIAEEIVSKSQTLNNESFASGEPVCGGQLLNLAGQTNLRELAALLSECDVLLTNDSGPMHIGYAVRTPLVAIFGSSDPALTGPPPEGNIVIKKDIECSPCFKRKCDKEEMPCMNAITASEVFDAISRLAPKNRAVFFDRDGTLCRDAHYLNRFEDLSIFDEAKDLRLLKEKGFKLIGVSNQSGIARGFVDEEFTKKVNNIFMEQYGFDDFFYCPHHPDEHCSCRKPEPEMALKARSEYNIDFRKSYVVGDKEADMLLAKAIGARGILVLTGQGKESAYADYAAKDLRDAVRWILNIS